MLNERYYQTDAVESIWSYFRSGGTGNPIVAMPTGIGKSVVIARFLQSVYAAYPHQRVLMLVDSKELIAQNYEKLLMAWPFAPAGVYSAGLKRKDVGKPITFAGIQSVWKLAALFGHVDLIMIDEVHMVPPKDMGMYRTFIFALLAINPNLKLIGLTATKWRMGQGVITDPIEDRAGNIIEPLFTDVCYDCTGVEDFNRFVAEGYLMPLRAKRVQPLLEADGIHMRGGEFIESELQSFVDAHDELTWQALVECREVAAAEGRRNWLVFTTGNRHADTVGQMLDQLDVSNAVVHTGRAGRDDAILASKQGRVTAIVNNNVLTKGHDNPLIDFIVVLRQIGSVVNWVQILGRGTRPCWATLPGSFVPDPMYDLETLDGRLRSIAAGGKLDCRVMDYGGNTRRLGPINDPIPPRRKGKGGGDAPVKACDRCDEWIHASLRDCPYCGYHFEFETKLKAEASSAEIMRGDDPIVEVFKVDHVTTRLPTSFIFAATTSPPASTARSASLRASSSATIQGFAASSRTTSVSSMMVVRCARPTESGGRWRRTPAQPSPRLPCRLSSGSKSSRCLRTCACGSTSSTLRSCCAATTAQPSELRRPALPPAWTEPSRRPR